LKFHLQTKYFEVSFSKTQKNENGNGLTILKWSYWLIRFGEQLFTIF